MNIQAAIKSLMQGNDLEQNEMQEVMSAIMGGDATASQISAFLVALAIKGETVDEIVGAASIMRNLAAPVDIQAEKIIDSVGTGGDGAKLFNVSTASSFVVAAAGGTVAKHGNRAASGNSGSADLLEAAGVNISINPQQVAECINEVGIGFMFAPMHHSAMKYAIATRKEIAVRTVFNLLGPITNPARATHQLTGVFSQHWVKPMAEVLGRLGSQHALVVHSDDGLDEISLATTTSVAEFKDGGVSTYTIGPEEFGIVPQSLDSLIIEDAAQSLRLIRSALAGEPGPAFDMIALNAGATLYAGDLADSLGNGVRLAQETLRSGNALKKLDELAAVSQRFS
ncbi:MAG: anthranilate phosphoribosyltransferase [Proteobacteria bacterium]|nr:anthranilate phosphoribosyltransferase [Pseudomonadota bacterium]